MESKEFIKKNIISDLFCFITTSSHIQNKVCVFTKVYVAIKFIPSPIPVFLSY